VVREYKPRPDLLDEQCPEGLRIVQITSDPQQPSNHINPEAHVFTPDSRRFVFRRQGQYWLCDIGDDYALRQLTDEPGTKACAVHPQGGWMYYLVDRTLAEPGTLILKRVSLEDFTRQTLLVLQGPVPGTNRTPRRVYSLGTMSSDGKRLAATAFIGDGTTENGPYGLLIFDLEAPSVSMVFEGYHFNNTHPQYCRSLDPVLSQDILLQHNHGSVIAPDGRQIKQTGEKGADLHVIRDDGTNWRDIPIGRDGLQYCQGHQQWRGRTGAVLSTMNRYDDQRVHQDNPMLLAWPVPTDETTSHLGFNVPGGSHVEVSRELDLPDHLWHFSSDLSGDHIVVDTIGRDADTGQRIVRILIGTLSPGNNPLLKVRHLLNPRTSAKGQPSHPHVFFSPDARMVFFNSDADGQPQVYMATGYEFPRF